MGYDEELAARAARARDVALFRYGLIRAAADPDLPPRQRGVLVRALAARQHKDPGGQPLRIGRSTLDRWIRDWRAGGFDALVPGSRGVQPRTSAGVLELAVALKKEKPERTAAQVHRILAARLGAGQVPSVRRWDSIAQPTTRRLHASSTTARYRKPAHVGTYVMSATHSRSGPVAVNWRSTRSGAGRAVSSRTVVWNGLRRLTPCTPAFRMSRATRFRPIWRPRAASSAWMRGAPYEPRDIR